MRAPRATTAGRFRRPRRLLGPEELRALVAMRDRGATWQEIGRVFGKQDCACKSIYDKAKRRKEANTML